MYKKNKILAIIPARGGSKGVPQKNLQKIGRLSLVERALHCARHTALIDRILVSTDCPTIQKVVNKRACVAPFLRPKKLATDKAASLPVFQHALDWAEKTDQCQYDYLVVLEPTCPFRLPSQIKKSLDLAIQQKASSVMSLVKVGDHHPIRIKKLGPRGKVLPFCIPEPEGLRRQDQEPAFIRNGGVYIFSRKTTKANRLWGDNPHGLELNSHYYSTNIDDPSDLLLARTLYKGLKAENKLNLVEAS